MEIWILITLAAAAVQTLRLMLQKQLKSAGLSTGGATFSRFIFAVPLAGLVVLAQIGAGKALPETSLSFWAFGFFGGVAQIIATFCTVTLFSMRNFAVGIAFTKTETVLVAGFSAVILGEFVSGTGLLAILIGVFGVLLLTVPAAGIARPDNIGRGMVLGLIAGAGYGLAAIGYRGATLALSDGDFLLRASVTLTAVTLMQTITMLVWLRFAEVGETRRVLGRWRETALVGLAGMLGSLGWFCAFALQNAAYVRALGQIELLFGIAIAAAVFKERVSAREFAGILTLGISLIMIVLAL